jgi:hypothetical protein
MNIPSRRVLRARNLSFTASKFLRGRVNISEAFAQRSCRDTVQRDAKASPSVVARSRATFHANGGRNGRMVRDNSSQWLRRVIRRVETSTRTRFSVARAYLSSEHAREHADALRRSGEKASFETLLLTRSLSAVVVVCACKRKTEIRVKSSRDEFRKQFRKRTAKRYRVFSQVNAKWITSRIQARCVQFTRWIYSNSLEQTGCPEQVSPCFMHKQQRQQQRRRYNMDDGIRET